MKYPVWIATLCLLTVAPFATADDDDVFARRGDGVVTDEAIDARIARIPERHRLAVIRDKSRIRDIVNEALRASQLAADAQAAGFDQDPEIQSRMALAAQEELAAAWLEHYVTEAAPADYDAMAREYFMVNKERFRSEPTIDVSHILIGNQDRSDQEALAIANDLYGRLAANPDDFDAFVSEYSDDPSAVSNHGRFKSVERGDMVKPFENQAFSMSEGEISEPVKTQFGYHLIRLDKLNPATQQSFEDIQDGLVERMRKQHQDRIRNEYLASLQNQPIELTEEDLEAMVIRHFGEEAVRGDAASE